MNKKADGQGVLIFFVVLIIGLLIWGFIGGQQSHKIGITCGTGLGDNLCWTWHQNIIGDIQEGISNTGNAVKDFVDDNSG